MKLDKIISESYTSTMYLDGDTVIKAFSHNISKSQVFGEAYVFSRISETSLKVPELLGANQLPDGRWAIYQKYIAGKSILQMIRPFGDYEKYIKLLIDIQLEINNIIIQDIPPLKFKLERKIQTLVGKQGLNGAKIYSLLTRLNGMPRHEKLVHGNLSVKSLVETEDGELYILGWGNAARGNGSAEAANTYLDLAYVSTAMAEDYLKFYCERAGVGKHYVSNWIPIMAASRLSDGHLSKAQTDVLMAWLDM
ncbi:MAG: aminoglycoside phosphotransferase [Eubacterium sp.]|jgi:hypothetical protein|nr:aminoglycoside phosphotransferase [Eubacterium sp.]